MSNLVVSINQFDITPFITNFRSRHTQRAYLSDLNYFFQFRQSRNIYTTPDQMQLLEFIAYRDFMVSEKLSPKTIARRLTSLKSMMEWFVENGHIKSNPAASLKIPKADVQKPTQALTDDEVRKILAQPNQRTQEGLLHSLMLHFLFMLGLRRSELAFIRLSDIYYVNNHLVLKIVGKGGRMRELPFNEELSKLLMAYLTMSKRSLGTDNPLFSPKGKLFLTGNMIYGLFKRYALKAGIKKSVSPHSARATAASKALEQNAPITEVADMLGHADIKTTQIYWKRRQGLENSPTHKLKY